MKKLLLDANFLVLPFQENVDIFAEFDRLLGSYTLHTLNRTYNEAMDLEDGRYREAVQRLVDENDIEVHSHESEKSVDDLLLELAGEYVVCTNDRELRKELDEQTLPYVHLRQRSHLEAENLQPSAF